MSPNPRLVLPRQLRVVRLESQSVVGLLVLGLQSWPLYSTAFSHDYSTTRETECPKELRMGAMTGTLSQSLQTMPSAR